MALLRVGALPDEALAAAAQFQAEVLPGALAFFSPPPLGEVASRSDDAGGPLRPFGAPPPKGGDRDSQHHCLSKSRPTIIRMTWLVPSRIE